MQKLVDFVAANPPPVLEAVKKKKKKVVVAKSTSAAAAITFCNDTNLELQLSNRVNDHQ